ncbi:expressed conserved protein [Echinococcus multilocularis]|uniref:Expressed conserved protein n=1 Tax=Echinococcus multilocularis TaxID=6211 RepID=A0A068YLQ3_ECHMU|nr:expressed conserved protein [Echinococcus multilocularis]
MKNKEASKKKAPKEKSKGDKSKKDKKGKNKGESQSEEKRKQPVARKATNLSMNVYGHPNAIEMFKQKENELDVAVDEYQVNLNVNPGNDSDGTLYSGDADFCLCVYDVRDPKTVQFLQKNILPNVRALNKVMAVAGLGLEYRSRGDQEGVSIDTASLLTRQFRCKGTELIYCDGKQLAAGAFSLYAAANPTMFTKPIEGAEEVKEDDGKKTKKEKKGKAKKEKPKKEKKK